MPAMYSPVLDSPIADVDEFLEILTGGYRPAQVVLTACRLDLFEHVGEGATAQELAARLDADLRGTRILADALVGLGLIRFEGGRYRNTALAQDYLRPQGRHSRVARLRHAARLYERWAGLIESVRTGRRASDVVGPSAMSESRLDFARAMADSARSGARQTAAALDLRSARTVLDVGGGPAVHAVEFARRNPRLTVTVLDHPETLEAAAETIREAGMEKRIRLMPGDAFEVPLGGPYDLVFMSNVLHSYSAEANRRLLQRAREVLTPGGRVALKDFFLESGDEHGKSGSLWNLLFAVNMLVNTDEGDCYTEEEVLGWCADLGLEYVQRIPVTPKSTVLMVTAPASPPPPDSANSGKR